MIDIGVFQALVNISDCISQIPSGLFADKFGKKKSLIVGQILLAFFYLILLSSRGYMWIGIAHILQGVGFTFIAGADESLLYESVQEKSGEQTNRFTQYIGRYAAIATLSQAIAMGLGGFLQLVSWNLVFGLSFLFKMISIIQTLFLKESKISETNAKEHKSLLKESFVYLSSNKAMLFYIISVGMFLGISSTYYWFSQDMLEGYNYKVYQISVIFAVESLISVVISDKAYIVEKHLTSKKHCLHA